MNFRKLFFAISFVFGLVVVFTACETTPVVSTTQLEETEKAVYQAFLKANFKVIKDSTSACIGDSTSFYPVYWEEESGIGDKTIQVGQAVSFRYTEYFLSTDVLGERVFNKSNLSDALPSTIIVNPSDTRTVPLALTMCLMHMKPYGKALMLTPSTHTNGNYYSIFYDIEVVFVSK